MESKERELEGGVQGEGKGSEGEREEGSGNGEKVKEGDEEIEQGISTVAISQGEKLEEESPPPQGVEKTELEKAALAEKKEWLKEEEEGEPLLVSITLPQSEFIMGLADLTGELMRNAINSLATGNTEEEPLLVSITLPQSE